MTCDSTFLAFTCRQTRGHAGPCRYEATAEQWAALKENRLLYLDPPPRPEPVVAPPYIPRPYPQIDPELVGLSVRLDSFVDMVQGRRGKHELDEHDEVRVPWVMPWEMEPEQFTPVRWR